MQILCFAKKQRQEKVLVITDIATFSGGYNEWMYFAFMQIAYTTYSREVVDKY